MGKYDEEISNVSGYDDVVQNLNSRLGQCFCLARPIRLALTRRQSTPECRQDRRR